MNQSTKEQAEVTESARRRWPDLLLALLCGLVGVGLIAGYIISVILVSRAEFAASRAAVPELNAAVSLKESEIIIENDDTVDWTEVELVLNPPVLRGGSWLKGGYQRSVDSIKAQTTLVTPLFEFRTAEGVRFDAEQQRPKSFLIRATMQGERRYFGAFIVAAAPEELPID